ncbi:RimK family alpha-L-glutamate ligase [Rhodonellum sp.]|uniref:ATP-grasp domain-containing protein n=1 Tax=Rhodonellum sp. TaxID=2231180 RepID=UPI002723BADC|nr:hypothetical protein [Rhodonellum sp.]MDO9551551.1 hypothetical protein [Rhodonellum sp.]
MIAIQNSISGFHPQWIAYCEVNNIPFKLVNCYANDLIDNLKGCNSLMWHFHHGSHKDNLIAKQILFALEHTGFKVFPDFRSAWHFDDKVAQKYMFESINAPIVPSYVFFDKKVALDWVKETTFPKVFKLRGGAGSLNVQLVQNEKDAKQIIQKAFGNGFSKYDAWESLKERWRKNRMGKIPFWEVIKGLIRLFRAPKYSRLASKEVGYVYFQDFIADQDSDTRIIVIGHKAFALKRKVREGDFRASGSSEFIYTDINLEAIKIAFNVADTLKLQCVGFDFIFNNGQPLIVEISYAFGIEGSSKCPGYWDNKLNWYEGIINKEDFMVELLLK